MLQLLLKLPYALTLMCNVRNTFYDFSPETGNIPDSLTAG
uniref:Uncharacterized protein n=1 Tax=Anopheles quadriannulatus TaxID=34691 RepID=A0A182XT87_ANOQN